MLAANRDEFYDRQGEPAEPRQGDPYDFVAPRDPRGGGTWIGINENGLLVALTNQPGDTESAPEHSRGHVVHTLLEETGNLNESKQYLQSLETEPYGAFSMVVISPDGILSFQLDSDGETTVERHRRGNFILSSERGFEWIETGEWDRFPWRSNSGREDPDKLRGRLQSFCKQTDSFRHRDAVCREGEEFGTLSSILVIVDRQRPELFIDFSQGPPCDSAYKAVSVSDEFKSSVFDRWGEDE